MKKNKNSLGYIRGLLKGAASDNEQMNEILSLMLDIMEEQSTETEKLKNQLDELDEYVEDIDDDLSEMEDMLDDIAADMFGDEDIDFSNDDDDAPENPLRLIGKDDERPEKHCHHHHKHGKCDCEDHDCDCDDEDCDCDDEDEEVSLDGFDNLFLAAMCPECSRLFCVEDPDFDDPKALYRCPYCGKSVHIAPISRENVPIAERVDE